MLSAHQPSRLFNATGKAMPRRCAVLARYWSDREVVPIMRAAPGACRGLSHNFSKSGLAARSPQPAPPAIPDRSSIPVSSWVSSRARHKRTAILSSPLQLRFRLFPAAPRPETARRRHVSATVCPRQPAPALKNHVSGQPASKNSRPARPRENHAPPYCSGGNHQGISSNLVRNTRLLIKADYLRLFHSLSRRFLQTVIIPVFISTDATSSSGFLRFLRRCHGNRSI